MEKVSVIIPIYNTDQYLCQCINSVIQQTYQNLEIILVNDGSTDNSGKICDNYKKLDYRVKVIHQENSGVTAARNAGLLQATGRYITFVDSDDWIDQKRIERMVDAMVREKVDLVYVPYMMQGRNGEFQDVIPEIPVGRYEGKVYENLIENVIDSNKFYHCNLDLSLYLILFQIEVFRKVQLNIPNDIRLWEDAICIYGVLVKSQSMTILNADGGGTYYYRRRLDSATHTVYEKDCKSVKNVYEFGETMYHYYAIGEKIEKQVRTMAYLSLIARAYDKVMRDEKFLFPFPQLVPGKKVAVYGAGLVGVSIVKYCMESKFTPIVLWVDKAFENYCEYYGKYGVKVDDPSDINLELFDYLLISVTDYNVASEIEINMIKNGVPKEKIVRFGNTELFTKQKLETVLKNIK